MSKSSARILIGVDGGGTGCRAAICDLTGTRLGEARSGAANFLSDPAGSIRHVRDAIERAAAETVLANGALEQASAHIGLAGILSDAHAKALAAALPFGHVTVSDDRTTSTVGALGARNGVLAAIGTGSFVVARQDGEIRAFGGWGLQIGDQASGAWLGRAALERCLLALDGLAADSGLMRDLRERYNNDPVEVVAFAKQAQPSDYAALAPMIVATASGGDANGQALMQAGAKYLNQCMAKSGLQADSVVCLTGGLGPHYEPYLDQAFRDRVCPPVGTALDGALLLAREEYNKMGSAE